LLNKAIARGATDVEFRRELIPAHQALGILLVSRGDLDGGTGELRAAVTQANLLMPIEPENRLWKSLAAGAQLELASTLLALGRVDEAAQQMRSGCALVAAIRGRNPSSSKQTACLTMRSRLALQTGAYRQAQALAQQALASSQSERNEDPVSNRFGVATAYRLLGDVYQRGGNAQAAKKAWSNALASLPRGIAEKPQELEQHAIILSKLGRAAEAKQIVSRLDAMGYRRLS
jgi:tetratricopeptide (TPR) repeat protein